MRTSLVLFGRPSLWFEGSEIDLGPNKQRGILAVLALGQGQHISASTVIDRVWGTEPPTRARELLYNYVARLRSRLASVPGVGIKSSNGYSMTLEDESVDVFRFRRIVADARLVSGSQQQVHLLREGLALWRDEPLAGLQGAWFSAMRASLETQRTIAIVERFELELQLGMHRVIVDELSALHAQSPGSEPLACLLMRAFTRCDLQTEALRVFRDTHRTLSELYGVEPGKRLCDLHHAVLSGAAI